MGNVTREKYLAAKVLVENQLHSDWIWTDPGRSDVVMRGLFENGNLVNAMTTYVKRKREIAANLLTPRLCVGGGILLLLIGGFKRDPGLLTGGGLIGGGGALFFLVRAFRSCGEVGELRQGLRGALTSNEVPAARLERLSELLPRIRGALCAQRFDVDGYNAHLAQFKQICGLGDLQPINIPPDRVSAWQVYHQLTGLGSSCTQRESRYEVQWLSWRILGYALVGLGPLLIFRQSGFLYLSLHLLQGHQSQLAVQAERDGRIALASVGCLLQKILDAPVPVLNN